MVLGLKLVKITWINAKLVINLVFKGQNVSFELKIGQNVDIYRINVGFELKIGQNDEFIKKNSHIFGL